MSNLIGLNENCIVFIMVLYHNIMFLEFLKINISYIFLRSFKKKISRSKIKKRKTTIYSPLLYQSNNFYICSHSTGNAFCKCTHRTVLL